MQRLCPYCRHIHFYQLGDGRLKCRRCAKRHTPLNLWTACRLSEKSKRHLIRCFVVGVPAGRAALGIASCPACERFYNSIRHVLCREVNGCGSLATAVHGRKSRRYARVCCTMKNGQVTFCPASALDDDEPLSPRLPQQLTGGGYVLRFRARGGIVTASARNCRFETPGAPQLLEQFREFVSERLCGYSGIPLTRFHLYLAGCLFLFRRREQAPEEVAILLESLLRSASAHERVSPFVPKKSSESDGQRSKLN